MVKEYKQVQQCSRYRILLPFLCACCIFVVSLNLYASTDPSRSSSEASRHDVLNSIGPPPPTEKKKKTTAQASAAVKKKRISSLSKPNDLKPIQQRRVPNVALKGEMTQKIKPQATTSTGGIITKSKTIMKMPTKYKVPRGIHPSKSTAPEKIQLTTTADTASNKAAGIVKRYECIAKIRKRIQQQLGPHVQTARNRPALIVDPAFHPNVGDNMIYLGEVEFLKSLGFVDTTQQKESYYMSQPRTKAAAATIQICAYRQASVYAMNCTRHLEDQDPRQVAHTVAYWHGGGNWGDIWPYSMGGRVNSFHDLLGANHSVVGFPQSFFYIKDQQRIKDTQTIRASIASGLGLDDRNLRTKTAMEQAASRVTLAWREVESFEKAQKEYPFATNVLVPDIAFFLGPFQQLSSPQKDALGLDILVFLREDKESVVASQRSDAAIRQILSSIPGGSSVKFGIADWNTRFALWPSQDYLFTDSAIQLLSLGRVVICDRLHAAILCYLSGVPFIYLDQTTGKLTKTLRVAFDSWDGCWDGEQAMWARAQSLEAALKLAVSFLKKYDI